MLVNKGTEELKKPEWLESINDLFQDRVTPKTAQ